MSKFFKNSKRDLNEKEEVDRVPQYKLLGAEPIPYLDSNRFVPNVKTTSNKEKENNIPDNTSIVDNEIIDNDTGNVVDILDNSEMIDNNYMDIDPKADQNLMSSIEDGQYVLIFKNEIFAINNFEIIQDHVSKLVFGEHDKYNGNVSIDDIIVLKKVKIKIGLFLEE